MTAWLPMPPEHIKRAVGVQDKDPLSVLACTRQLVRLRKAHPAIRSGGFVELNLPSPLLGFERVEGGDHVRCLFNLGKSVKRCRMVEQGTLLFECGEIDQAKGVMGGLSACWLKL